jgi:predicted GNAT family acetyltransferase
MYNLFINKVVFKIRELEEQIKEQRANLTEVIETLEKISPFVFSQANFTKNDLYNLNQSNIKSYKVNKDCKNYDTVHIFLKDIKNMNNTVSNLSELLQAEKNKKVPLVVYKQIVKEFNKNVLKLIVEQGLTYSCPHGCGVLKVKRKENQVEIRRVNWELSNKIKKRIQRDGGTPYNKDYAPNGEKWLVYHSNDFDCWLAWGKSSSSVLNSSYYSFKPAKTAIKALLDFRKLNPLNDYLYNGN